MSRSWLIFSFTLSILLHAGLAAGLLYWQSGSLVKPIVYSPSFTVALYEHAPQEPTPKNGAPVASPGKSKTQGSVKKAAHTKWKVKTKPVPRKRKQTVHKKHEVSPKALSKKETAKEKALVEKALAQVVKDTYSVGGINREAVEIQYKEYYDKIWRRVRANWILPTEIATSRQNLMAVVTVRIARDGTPLDIELERSSGNRLFDDSCMRAARKTVPFPPLPKDYPERYMELGLRFRPE